MLSVNLGSIFVRYAEANSKVNKGDLIAKMVDTYTGRVVESVKSPVNGIVFFHASQPIIYSHTILFRIIPTDDLY